MQKHLHSSRKAKEEDRERYDVSSFQKLVCAEGLINIVSTCICFQEIKKLLNFMSFLFLSKIWEYIFALLESYSSYLIIIGKITKVVFRRDF